MRKVYLDYNASTPIAPEVAAAMQPFLVGEYGNPSSLHWASDKVKLAIERARSQVASVLGSRMNEIVFTSSGTEASNLAIKGLFFADWGKPFHVITSAVEHAATLAPCRFIESLGAELTVLPVDRFGRVDPEDVRRAIRSETRLVTILHAQNEVGTIQPVSEIAKITRERGIALHVDAAQSIGKIRVKVSELGADLLSITGQKVYAPKGVGALYVREGIRLSPLIHGPSNQEHGLRAGSESALLAVALGAACELVEERRESESERLKYLRDRFYHGLCDVFGDWIQLNGHPSERLPNTINVSFLDQVGGEMLARIPSIAASTGSACHSGSRSVSPTLAAMGISERWGLGSLRFSFGKNSNVEEVDYTLKQLRMFALCKKSISTNP